MTEYPEVVDPSGSDRPREEPPDIERAGTL